MPEQNKQTKSARVKIPQFMVEQNASVQAENERINRNTSNIYKLMLGISGVWALIVIIYITQFFGWSLRTLIGASVSKKKHTY